jgi:hypothetical protein
MKRASSVGANLLPGYGPDAICVWPQNVENPAGEDDMSNLKKLISTTSYDMWIAWIYAIISLLAIVAVYGLSTHGDPSASETIASLYSQQP